MTRCTVSGCPYSADDLCAAPSCPQRFPRRPRAISKIGSISSIAELDAYEVEAKQRGIRTEELVEIHQKRLSLTPKGRRRR